MKGSDRLLRVWEYFEHTAGIPRRDFRLTLLGNRVDAERSTVHESEIKQGDSLYHVIRQIGD